MKVGDFILKTLRSFMGRYKMIGDVRGKGLLIGVEIVKDKWKKIPGPEVAKAIKDEALRRGLLLYTTGRYYHVLTITPSLTITMDEAGRGLSILEKALASV